MSKKKKQYNCVGHPLTFPDNGEVKCRGSIGSIITPGTKCSVTCSVGSPNVDKLECKHTFGWRPTNKVACEGVSPGVIVGALIGGLAAVILIAIIYAKYKQHKKSKNKEKNPIQNKVDPARRPGRTVLVGASTDRPARSKVPLHPVSGTATSGYGSEMELHPSTNSNIMRESRQLTHDRAKMKKPSESSSINDTNQLPQRYGNRRPVADPVVPVRDEAPPYGAYDQVSYPVAQQQPYTGSYGYPSGYGTMQPPQPTLVGYDQFEQPPASLRNNPGGRGGHQYQRPYNVVT